MKKLGIYIHIPFCLSKCFYCDFYSLTNGNAEEHIRYVDSLVLEIQKIAKNPSSDTPPCDTPIYSKTESVIDAETKGDNNIHIIFDDAMNKEYIVDSIFIGGGTPSILDSSLIANIVETVKNQFIVTPDAEITIESNPKTLTRKKLQDYRNFGINRLSIGVQSMSDSLLKAIGRSHNKKDILESFAIARECGFDNINVDLIFGLPGQTVSDWEDTLEEAISLSPEHISFYSLQIEEETPIYNMIKEGIMKQASDIVDRKMYSIARKKLHQNNYECYEISNASKIKNGLQSKKDLLINANDIPKYSYKCRHNLKYWNMDDYLGVGSGASSFINNKRFSYQNSLEFATLDFREYNENTVEETMSEYVFTGLRKSDGISILDFKSRFDVDFWDAFNEIREISSWIFDDFYIIEENDRLYLSKKGIDISNRIMSEFV